VSLLGQPASTERVHLKWNRDTLADFINLVAHIDPSAR
jgi:hypothetical protein